MTSVPLMALGQMSYVVLQQNDRIQFIRSG